MSEDVPYDGAALIADYVKVRELKSKLEEKHKAKVAEYNNLMAQLETRILKFLQDNNIETVSSEAGTAYVRTVRSAGIADAELFKNYVILNGQFGLVDWKANAPAVADHIEETGAAPPGVNFSTMQKIGVRRK